MPCRPVPAAGRSGAGLTPLTIGNAPTQVHDVIDRWYQHVLWVGAATLLVAGLTYRCGHPAVRFVLCCLRLCLTARTESLAGGSSTCSASYGEA